MEESNAPPQAAEADPNAEDFVIGGNDVDAARVKEAEIAQAEIEREQEEWREENKAEIDAAAEKEKIKWAFMGTVSIGRVVEYRSRTGNYSVPAVVNCCTSSIYQPGV